MCNFGILLTQTSEEGLILYKEEMVEYFPPVVVVIVVVWSVLLLLLFEEASVCKTKKAFCVRVYSVVVF